MSNDKLIIDLRRLKLTNKQRQALHNAIHKTVTKQLEKITDAAEEQSAPAGVMTRGGTAAAVRTMTAKLQITFFNVDPGNSKLTAILNDEEKTVHQSGVISFNNVQSGDMILIQVKSLGRSTVTIDVSADPMQMSFPPGGFQDQFFIN